MYINKRDADRLNFFIDRVVDFLESKNISQYYTETSFNPNVGIELIDGTILPVATEGPMVLHNEFNAFITGILIRYIELMRQNSDNRLFGFAERPLLDFITSWVFITVSKNSVTFEDRERVITLLFAGNYKYIENGDGSFDTYILGKGSNLTKKYLHALRTLEVMPYFNRLWGIFKDEILKKKSLSNSLSYLEQHAGYLNIIGHQHMRVHANLLSLNELSSNTDQEPRHLVMLALYLRQVVDYYRESDYLPLRLISHFRVSQPRLKEYYEG